MKKKSITLLFSAIFFISSFSFASDIKVGGVKQIHPKNKSENNIGLGWGHKSMTYGMMNLISGMTTQVAKIIRSDKAPTLMTKKLADILDHIAEMINYTPAYMMGTMVVDAKMVDEMHDMLKEIEKMRIELDL